MLIEIDALNKDIAIFMCCELETTCKYNTEEDNEPKAEYSYNHFTKKMEQHYLIPFGDSLELHIPETMRFNIDWNWLIPVCQKIVQAGWSLKLTPLKISLQEELMYLGISNVYLKAVAFILAYNEELKCLNHRNSFHKKEVAKNLVSGR